MHLVYRQVWQQCSWLKNKRCLCLTPTVHCHVIWNLPTVNGLWSPQREGHQGNDNLSTWWVNQAVPGVGKEGGSLSHVAQGGLALGSVRQRNKAPLGKRAFCKVWTDGTDTVLTFLQGLGHRTDPLEGRFMSDSQVRKLEFTGKHISPFSVGPCVEMPT